MATESLILVESNTTGSGRLFCAAARRMGLRPVLLSRAPGRYPYVEWDAVDHVVVDTGDFDAVRTACVRVGDVVGVTSSSEYFIARAAAVARSLGLPHPVPEAVATAQNKNALRTWLREAGLPVPDFGTAQTANAAVEISERIGFPVVVKPVVGSGSVGVRLCVNGVDVKTAVAVVLDAELAAPNAPRPTTVLVEGYLDGPEFSVETFDDRVVGVTAKHLGPAPYFVETGHDFPASLTASDEAAIGDVAVHALRVLGLGWGAAHTEVRLTSAGPRIVEINPRLAGGMIPQVVAEATGVDLIFCVVARAAQRAMAPQATRHRAASIRFVLADRSGMLTAIHGVEQAQRCPGVVGVGVVGAVGEHLEIRRSFRDRIAYVITVADDGESAATAADAGARMIAAEIVPDPADPGAVRR